MEKVKIKNIKTGAIEEVKKALAGDYIGTGNFVLYEENEEFKPKTNVNREERLNVKY